jgi:hypothetical protein
MALTHNQWAVVAITVTLCLAGTYSIAGSIMSTAIDYEDGASDILDDDTVFNEDMDDFDEDGLSDRLERNTYGTDPYDEDTDGDGMTDGYEVNAGLNPLDSGDAGLEDIITETETDTGDDNSGSDETWPDPDNGPLGDPDKDGLVNIEEMELGTDPRRNDTDGDGLNDKWESLYTFEMVTQSGELTLFDPLNGNWDCILLDAESEANLEQTYGSELWSQLENFAGQHSCDQVLDFDSDTLANFAEESYGTNPLAEDSDGDLIGDQVEVAMGAIQLEVVCGKAVITQPTKDGPFTTLLNSFPSTVDPLNWFIEDMDGDGRNNGPGDWDTDGDGMPDGFEYCYDTLLNAANASDAFGDEDEDGLNNRAEYDVARVWGASNFTSPLTPDTDEDGMPDGWESDNGLNPVDGENAYTDPDMDGWDANGNGKVTYSDLTGIARVYSITVELMEYVDSNQTVAYAKITHAGGNEETVPIKAPSAGYVYGIPALSLLEGPANENEVTSRGYVWMTIVEESEMFTNLMEYQARDRDNDGIIDGRSTDPLNSDTDGDGLIDGIEVMGWQILVVSRGVHTIHVTSDPGDVDTDDDGLTDWREFGETYTNASNKDTDSDGLEDYVESVDGFQWLGEPYFTNASMFDTDIDGLEDGEEVIMGLDNYVTHANDSDSDDDGLNDGNEVLYIPRPWQAATNPLVNDTDQDGMLDGWEMQVQSTMDNTNSHSLWVTTTNFQPPGCTDVGCTRGPGGWLWNNWIQGFESGGDENNDGEPDPKYFLWDMNLTNFAIPESSGRWALDPALGSLPDADYDIDNDSLPNDMEGPNRWNTNPVNDDTDNDKLPDGWEVKYSAQAISQGLIDNTTLQNLGARGPMDPALEDSDLDGVMDGDEDFDHDGLNRTAELNRFCPGWNDPTSALCHISPDDPEGAKFYNDLENYTNYEEMLNGTNPVLNDTDGDGLEDGPEVYHMDSDGDSMFDGWEYYFRFDPFDGADAKMDVDGDGFFNDCEHKWHTNPREGNSFPGQGQQCDQWA